MIGVSWSTSAHRLRALLLLALGDLLAHHLPHAPNDLTVDRSDMTSRLAWVVIQSETSSGSLSCVSFIGRSPRVASKSNATLWKWWVVVAVPVYSRSR